MVSSCSSPIWKSLSLSCLPAPIPFPASFRADESPCSFHRRFSSLADSTTHSQEVSQARASSHQPFHLLFVFHSYKEISPPCQTICMFCKRWWWCKCQEVHVVYYLCNTCFVLVFFTSRLFTLHLVLPYSDLDPKINSKGKSKFKSCKCACEWLGQKKGMSWSGSFFATSPLQPLCPKRWWRRSVFVQLHSQWRAVVCFHQESTCSTGQETFLSLGEGFPLRVLLRRQTNPFQHLCRPECPSERTLAVSRINSETSLPNHYRWSSQLRLKMLLELVMETISTTLVLLWKLSK